MTAVEISRQTGTMASLTALSRASGFVRVLVVTAVLGTSYLANTYQSANSVPNLLFELLAAGALQAGLIPTLVRLVDRGDDRRTGSVAGAMLGIGCAVTGVAAAASAIWGRQIMGWIVDDVPDAAVRARQIELGAFLLMVFAPQAVLYVANAVCTGVLHARGRFAVPAAAPIVNNAIVIATYVVFARMTHGSPSLELSTAQRWVLGGGTTLGVAFFCGWVVVAGRAAQPHLRPNLRWRDPDVRSVVRSSGWVIGLAAAVQILTFSMIRVVNRREGGVAMFTVAWVLFVLPYSLLVVPVVATRFPRLVRAAATPPELTRALSPAVRSVTFCAAVASALLVALAHPLSRLLVQGRAVSGRDEVAAALTTFAIGLSAYGIVLVLTRVSYARGDAHTPCLVTAVAVAAALVVLAGPGSEVPIDHLIAWVGWVHTGTYLLIMTILGALVLRGLAGAGAALRRGSRILVGQIGVAVAVGASGRFLVDTLGTHGWAVDLTTVAGGGAVMLFVMVVLIWGVGGPPPREALFTFGAGRRT